MPAAIGGYGHHVALGQQRIAARLLRVARHDPAAGDAEDGCAEVRDSREPAGAGDAGTAFFLQVERQEDDEDVPDPDDAEESGHHAPDLAVLEESEPRNLLGSQELGGALAFDVVQFLRADALVLFGSAVVEEEGQCQHEACDAEEEEDGLPAEREHDGGQDGRRDGGSPFGTAVPDGGGLSALGPGEPVSGELGRRRPVGGFGDAEQEAEGDELPHLGADGHQRGRDAPARDCEEVHPSGAQLVHEPARGQLGKSVGPGEHGAQEANVRPGHAEVFDQLRRGDGDRAAVHVVDDAGGQRPAEDPPPQILDGAACCGFLGPCGQSFCLHSSLPCDSPCRHRSRHNRRSYRVFDQL